MSRPLIGRFDSTSVRRAVQHRPPNASTQAGQRRASKGPLMRISNTRYGFPGILLVSETWGHLYSDNYFSRPGKSNCRRTAITTHLTPLRRTSTRRGTRRSSLNKTSARFTHRIHRQSAHRSAASVLVRTWLKREPRRLFYTAEFSFRRPRCRCEHSAIGRQRQSGRHRPGSERQGRLPDDQVRSLREIGRTEVGIYPHCTAALFDDNAPASVGNAFRRPRPDARGVVRMIARYRDLFAAKIREPKTHLPRVGKHIVPTDDDISEDKCEE